MTADSHFHSEQTLKDALRRYGASLPPNLNRPEAPKGVFSAAVTAALTMPFATEGAVIYMTGPVSLVRTMSNTTVQVGVDLDGSAGNDVFLSLGHFKGSIQPGKFFFEDAFAQVSVPVANKVAMTTTGGSNLKGYGLGAKIETGPYFSGPTGRMQHVFQQVNTNAPSNATTLAVLGTWVSSSTQFAGIRFVDGAALNHFGWLRLHVAATPHGLPNQITLIDWAYESTPDTPIQAGEGAPGFGSGSIPETETVSLMGIGLLAMGAAGVRRFRKAKAQEKEQAT